MARSTAFRLPLLFAIFFCAQGIASADFDFYYFVLQWPGSYCRDAEAGGCCTPDTPYDINPDFLIKGLYTYDNDGHAVTKCNGTSFSVKALTSIIWELSVKWPSIACPSNNGLSQWMDAWNNYGVCSGLNELEYFETALKLRNEIDILSVLKWKAIIPNDLIPYNPTLVKAAIKLGLGVDVGIQCSRNKYGWSQFNQVFVCVDKKGSKVIDCPVMPKFNCGLVAYFPTFSVNMLKEEDDGIQMVVDSQTQ